MVLIQVAIGGITRLTDSGLSMTNWEPVKGSLPPLTEQAWQAAFEDYSQYPEFYKKNADFTLAEFKAIFWWEYIHRAWARLIGLVFLFPFLYFHKKGWIDKKLRWQLGGVVLLAAAQAVMGWVMVKSGMVDNPWVSPYRLTVHLFLALALFCWLYWLVLKVSNEDRIPDRLEGASKALKPFLWLLTILVLIQVAYGGLVAGSDAARYFNTWPDMNGQIVPDILFEGGFQTKIISENKITTNFIVNVQFIHRTLAILVVFFVGLFWLKSRKYWDSAVMKGANLLLLTVAFQFALGVLTIISSSAQQIHVELGSMHQLGAFILTGVLVFLHFTLRKIPRQN